MNNAISYPRRPSTSLTHSEAIAIAEAYLKKPEQPGLTLRELKEYSNNYYLSMIEKSSERGALELIIDRYSGRIRPELQSMMWNTKYRIPI